MNKRRRKIAFISEHASPLACIGTVDTGGQNVYVAQLAKHLAEIGYEIDIYTRRDDAKIADVIEWQKNIRVIHVKAGPECNIIKEEMLQYMQEFSNNMIAFIVNNHLRYELIHANFFMSGMVACGIKKQLHIPFVITFHALGHIRRIHQAGKDKFPAERITIEEKIVRDADYIIAECPQDKDDLITHYKAEPAKITIVPCGFNPSEFYPIEKAVARKILKLPSDSPVLLQLGRMVRRKGIDNVIRAFAHIETVSGKHSRLVIVGGDCEDMKNSHDKEYKRLYCLAERLNVTDKIEFAGRKSRDQLKFYYNAADVFITTPWYEPFGITPLEAMACGTPVIGANVGGIKFSVKEGVTGSLVPPRQPKKLAEKISRMIADQEMLKRMEKNAIKHVNAYFTWSKVADQVSELYQYVIAGSGTTRHINHDNRAA